MVQRALIFTLLFARAWQEHPGPKCPPTKGEVWPNPQHEKKEMFLYKFQKAKFAFKVLNNTCKILTDALDRARKELNKMHDAARTISRRYRKKLRSESRYTAAVLNRLEVEMGGPCEEYPYFGMDESYNLTVSTVSKLTSPSIWGMLRGLESFVQLFYNSDDFMSLLVNGTSISDFPRYPHRGLLLDTARHYLPTATIKETLNAMAMNKLNVFHWHIVDDQSFPFQSEKFPELSEKGAYHWTMVYTKSDIKGIVNYARDRGIRVIPEMDVPGHTRSWGKAYPQLIAECFVDEMKVAQGPLDPTSDFTYKLLRELLQEVQQWFPDKYLHLGGDEINTLCWETCPNVADKMHLYNISSAEQFANVFFTRLIPLLRGRSHPIVWQDAFDDDVLFPNDTLIQIWKPMYWGERINAVLSKKLRVVYSSEWYLDKMSEWERMYMIDPRLLVNDVQQLDNVVGGEACMWGEYVDSNSLMSSVWPRASTVAERLWSHAFIDDAIRWTHKDPSNQPPSSTEPVIGHPRSTLRPVYQERSNNIKPEVQKINKEAVDIDRQSGKVDVVPHPSKNLESVSQTNSTLQLQTRGKLEQISQTRSTLLLQTSDTLEPDAQTIKLVTHKVDLSVLERANFVMEQMLMKHSLKSVSSRLEEHACRMIRRGVPTQPPNGAGFCVV